MADSSVMLSTPLPPINESYLRDLSPDTFAAWGVEHSTDLDYRVELSRRIAFTFNDADQLIMFDDIAIQIIDSPADVHSYCRGFDRTLLPALWLSTGFRSGACILIYTPPNPVELKEYLKVKSSIEQSLQRQVRIRILYDDGAGHLHELIHLFRNHPDQYLILCEKFIDRPSKDFYPKYHIDMLKKHLEIINEGVRRSFVFPYCMMELHDCELKMYSDRLLLPDIPKNDKAEHHFFLKSKGFTALPHLIAVSANGSLIDNYEDYKNAIKNLNSTHLEHTSHNIEVFSRAIVRAIDQLYYKYNLTAFVKLDSSGAGGWSSMSRTVHSTIYDFSKDEKERVLYMCEYIDRILANEILPPMAVIEEFIDPKKCSDGIDGDYTVCGFVLNGHFFPTSINLCSSENGAYIEQWTSSSPSDLGDSPSLWQHMFRTYAQMIELEATEFNYRNGIYAGDLFVAKDGSFKQRDWNIRRGGRSAPESLTIFNIPNYETKLLLNLAELKLGKMMNSLELFHVYTKICEQLMREYTIYILSSGFGYFAKNPGKDDSFKFNVLVHTKYLEYTDEDGEKKTVPKYKHRQRLFEIVKSVAVDIFSKASY